MNGKIRWGTNSYDIKLTEYLKEHKNENKTYFEKVKDFEKQIGKQLKGQGYDNITIDEAKVKSVWGDSNFNLDDTYQEICRKLTEYRENMLIEDIINIYIGIFETYDEYREMVVRFNEISEHQRNNVSFDNSYTFRYTPEKTALTKRAFDFIKELKKLKEQLKCNTTN